jgi:cytochrome c-type biogenesis protein CcmH/NrfG
MLENGRLAEAEREFRAARAASLPTSVEPALGLAYVLTLRGGAEAGEARTIIADLLELDPAEPRAHYLLGRVQQQSGEGEAATASFRKSAEILMSRRREWNVIPGRQGPNGQQ